VMSDADGVYSMTVPYSTTGWGLSKTQFDTMPTGRYIISAGGATKEFDVTEPEIQNGMTVSVDVV